MTNRHSKYLHFVIETKKRTRTPLVLAATIDAGLLRTAAEKKNDEEILMHIRDKDCVALEVRYHGICYNPQD